MNPSTTLSRAHPKQPLTMRLSISKSQARPDHMFFKCMTSTAQRRRSSSNDWEKRIGRDTCASKQRWKVAVRKRTWQKSPSPCSGHSLPSMTLVLVLLYLQDHATPPKTHPTPLPYPPAPIPPRAERAFPPHLQRSLRGYPLGAPSAAKKSQQSRIELTGKCIFFLTSALIYALLKTAPRCWTLI